MNRKSLLSPKWAPNGYIDKTIEKTKTALIGAVALF